MFCCWCTAGIGGGRGPGSISGAGGFARRTCCVCRRCALVVSFLDVRLWSHAFDSVAIRAAWCCVCCFVSAAPVRVGCFLSLLAAWGLVCVLQFLCCWSALVGRMSVLECAFWGFLLSFALLHLFPLLHLFVTLCYNGGNRCNSANNSIKPQKAHSKTQSRPTSADQQHRKEAHEQGPELPATARSRQCAPGRRKQNNSQLPTALSATEQKSMRLYPDTREGYMLLKACCCCHCNRQGCNI